jgi:hypothetical protein
MADGNAMNERDALLFGVRRSVRYHRRRERFFDAWGKFTSAVNVIFGSAAVTAILGSHPHLGIAAGIVVAVMSTVDLVVGSSTSARNHSDLARRFIELEAKIERASADASLAEFKEGRLEIEGDEPPVLRTLDAICHNELAKSMGRDDQIYKVGFFRRRLAQFISFDTSNLRPLNAEHR